MRRRGPARIRTYVRTWRVHRWRLRIMSWAVVSWDPPFIGLPDDDDDERRRRRQRGGVLVSDLRTVACVRTWRMFPRPYVRTHTLRGSVHACERYVQLNVSCTYVRCWWPLPFWPNAISADFNSRYVRTYALFSLPIIPGLSRSCYSWIETGVETATRSSWVETGVMFVHVVEAVRGSRRR